MHKTYASISLAALNRNLIQIRRHLANSCHMAAVVKANAYGHGAVDISRALVQQGVSRLAVASVSEGLVLREAGITADILVLAELFDEHIPDLLTHRLTPVITDQRLLPTMASAAGAQNRSLPIHIKVDTGMGRLGFSPEEVIPLLETLSTLKSVHVEGVMTHLADSDGPDTSYSERQLERFQKVLSHIDRRGLAIPFIHAANSAAIVRFPQSHFSMVRPGIMLYGYHTLPPTVASPPLEPVLSLRTTVMQVRTVKPGDGISYNRTFVATKPTRIAVLPIGYADGYNRKLSNNGFVLLQSRRVPIVGSVCMDMTMVDVTDLGPVKVGDEVVLIGAQGQEAIGADEVARWAGTISYEVLCAIGPRVPRLYQAT